MLLFPPAFCILALGVTSTLPLSCHTPGPLLLLILSPTPFSMLSFSLTSCFLLWPLAPPLLSPSPVIPQVPCSCSSFPQPPFPCSLCSSPPASCWPPTPTAFQYLHKLQHCAVAFIGFCLSFVGSKICSMSPAGPASSRQIKWKLLLPVCSLMLSAHSACVCQQRCLTMHAAVASHNESIHSNDVMMMCYQYVQLCCLSCRLALPPQAMPSQPSRSQACGASARLILQPCCSTHSQQQLWAKCPRFRSHKLSGVTPLQARAFQLSLFFVLCY